jgi:hypothetical protein
VDFASMDQLLLPYGQPEVRAGGDVWLPPLVAAATACARIRVHRDNTTSGHFLELDDHGTLDVIDFQDAWEQLGRLPVAADVPRLLGLHGAEPPRVRIGLSVGADTRETHGILVLCLLYLHPFLLLDEAVSLAVAVCILVYRDNRTMTDEHLKRCTEWHRVQWARLLDSDPGPEAEVASRWQAVSGYIPRARAIAAHRPRAARARSSVPVPLRDPWAVEGAPEPKKKCIRETLAALQTSRGPPPSRDRPAAVPSRLTQVRRLLTQLNKHQRWQHGMRHGFAASVDPRLAHSISPLASPP